jgi:hypothetical protein
VTGKLTWNVLPAPTSLWTCMSPPWARTMAAIATTELPISWSPQPGFLHQRAEVDTLGIDEPESQCQLQ